MAVVVKNLVFSYSMKVDSVRILNSVCINVPTGSIYGLLGPSGCGKTTLLKSVCGLCKPTSGDVLVFGYKPGTPESGVPGAGVGYMPQELAVQVDLTIGEILVYFGTIFSLKKSKLQQQIDFLLNTFELPEKNRIIVTLSGGQRRRLSLAIALLHNPRLLILDEPTVGVDPLLSRKIWDLIENLSLKMKTTVIITTHYIEEAKRANFVAFMRKGRIIAENSTSTIVRRFETENLEDVFLKLCCLQETKIHRLESVVNDETNEHRIVKEPLKDHIGKASVCTRFINIMMAMITKFVIETRRSPLAMIVLFVTTLSLVLMVVVYFGQTPKFLPIAWVVDEPYFDVQCYSSLSTEENNEIVNCLNSSSVIHDDSNSNLVEVIYAPEIFRSYVDNSIIDLKNYTEFKEAFTDLKKKAVHGIIHFSRNFSKSYLQSNPFLGFNDQWVNTSTIETGTIKLYVDASNLIIQYTIRISLQVTLLKFQESIATEYGENPMVTKPLISVEPIFDSLSKARDQQDFFGAAEFLAPGMLTFAAYFTSVVICVLSLMSSPECDMSLRSYVSGVKSGHVVAGQILARLPFVSLSAALNLIISIYVLKFPCKGSSALALAALLLITFSGLTHGMFFATAMPASSLAMISVFGIVNALQYMSATIFPASSMPKYVRWIQPYLPFSSIIEAFREVTNKGHSFTHPLVWRGFLSSTIWTIFPLLLSNFILKRKMI